MIGNLDALGALAPGCDVVRDGLLRVIDIIDERWQMRGQRVQAFLEVGE